MPRKPITAATAVLEKKEKKKREKTATFISNFHKNPKEKELEEVQEYQRASLKYGSRFDTSKWLLTQLKLEFTEFTEFTSESKSDVKLLDVGALVLGYTGKRIGKRLIEAEYINLQPPPGHLAMAIQQRDFMKLENQSYYDVLCLSLVLNFVPDAGGRGQMLQQAGRLLRSGGYLYIVLPRACLQNSRYLDLDEFNALLSLLSFTPLKHHFSSKLYFGLFTKNNNQTSLSLLYKPKLKYPNGKRNNFKVALI